MTDLVRLDSLFTMMYGHSLEKVHLEETKFPDGVNFVSRTSQNNGVSGRVKVPDGVIPSPAGVITVAMGGSVLSTFLQNEESVSGRDVQILTPQQSMSDAEKLFYCMVIRSNAYRYSYGRQANRTLPSLLVPAKAPDWVNDYDPDTILGEFEKPVDDDTQMLPPHDEWVEFGFNDLFDMVKGGGHQLGQIDPGDTPLISAKATDNSIAMMADVPPKYEAGSITVTTDGSVGYATVQPAAFDVASNAMVFTTKTPLSWLTKFFLCTLIREEAKRFSYGRKWNLARMRASSLRLPVNDEGNPDWELIESYMRTLRYSSQCMEPEDQE